MRRLLLFRHAKAERANDGEQDHKRALTPRGRKDAARIGSYIANHLLIPDHVIISPAKRTQETWKYAAAAFNSVPTAMIQERLYDAQLHIIFDAIKDTATSAHILLVIGHNPALHELALMLVKSGEVNARERLKEKLPPAGLVIIDFASDDWKKLRPQSGHLEGFITPKLLKTRAFDE